MPIMHAARIGNLCMVEPKHLRIGTRGSPLALAQARLVQAKLATFENVPDKERDVYFPIMIFKTSGDALTDQRLIEAGGKGLFTKELEDALITRIIDLAVHSMKDVPTNRHPELRIGAILEREDPRDAFISFSAKSLMGLKPGAILGTASIRRQVQALRLRPDIKYQILRGNVGTRLEKLKSGICDATFLAVAGLNRLGQRHVITEILEPAYILPAPAQGAIGAEIRANDKRTARRIAPLNHQQTEIALVAERAFLNELDGSCRMPISALAEIDGKTMHFRAQVFSADGKEMFARETWISLTESAQESARAAGITLALEIKREAENRILWNGI